MGQPKKRAVSKRKVKCKCKCHQKLSIVKKGQQIGKNDTLPKAPTQMPRDNGINMRVKIRRKQ